MTSETGTGSFDNSRAWTYGYDALNQLATDDWIFDDPKDRTDDYDDAGNRARHSGD